MLEGRMVLPSFLPEEPSHTGLTSISSHWFISARFLEDLRSFRSDMQVVTFAIVRAT